MLMGDDIRPIIRILSKNFNKEALVDLFLDSIYIECKGADVSSSDVFEQILMTMVTMLKEE